MIDTPEQRRTLLAWASLCAGLFVLLAGLVLTAWPPLLDLDVEAGQWPYEVTSENGLLERFWVGVARITDWLAMILYTVAAAVVLWIKNHRRAAIWTLLVMGLATLSFWLLKLAIGRTRPEWDEPIEVLTTYSFPSGHATRIAAAAGISIVLAVMLVRRRGLRRLVMATFVGLALLVGADRVFLGVHNVSDVVAGFALGGLVVLLSLLAFDPRPRSIAEKLEPLPHVSGATLPRSLACVLNPIKVDDPNGFKVMVEKMAEESGFQKVRWWETTVEDTGYAMAHDAAVAGVDLVLAIGGDGTNRAVCEELAGTGIPVGIVPAGTGNLLARNLSIPLYLRAAVDVGLNGQDRAIDMVEISGDEMEPAVFLVMAGMGFDAAIMEGVNEDFKKKVGWLAYVWSALKALMFPAIKVEVSVDGAEFTSHKARTVVIGNVGYLQAGMPLLPDAAIDDGKVDVVLLYPRKFLSWLPIVARVLTKNPRTDDTIVRMSGQRIVVKTSSPAPRQLDGDLIPPGRELVAECVHGRLLVRVPR